MKILFVPVLLFMISCNNNEKKKDAHVPGVYKMLSQNLKNGTTDTTSTTLQQLKIYTDDFMMYANVNAPDSIGSFGIGSYSFNRDTITENVIYSAYDTSKDEKPATFKLAYEKTAKGYKQIIPDIISQGQHYKLTEEYDSTGTATKTALDGAWKETKAIYIKGKDTIESTIKQYKTYYNGYLIWGHTWEDSTKKTHTGMGFGKFEMNGNNKVKESMIASTYYEVRGKDFEIDIAFNGNDEFKQTMNNKDGSMSIEIYQRLKKAR